MTTEMRFTDREIIHLLPIVEADGCARYGKGEATCRWKCGSQCAHEAPNDTGNDYFENVVRRFISRRTLLGSAAAATAALVVTPRLELGASTASAQATDINQAVGPNGTLAFKQIVLDTDDAVNVPEGYTNKVLIRWGDPLFLDSPAFNPFQQTAAAQVRQFGYNCDFIGVLAQPFGADGKDRSVLAVNHEYTNPELMFFGYAADAPTREQVDVELAAHGMSILEVRRSGAEWFPVPGAMVSRRITGETRMLLSGPAAGNDLLKTSEDPTGTMVRGMLNNCGGGVTPWGTILTGEENFNQYFANAGKLADSEPRKALHRRYGLTTGESERKWERFHKRFDIEQEPNEPFRFGWIVEIDPYDPTSTPKKRTALGRTKHEAAASAVGPDGRVGVYMGDDERFDYVYKFVTNGRFNPNDRAANRDLLDDGVLYVAKFNDDGSGQWLPLVQGQGPLTPANGFASQGDVMINVRLAGDAVGATKMDRPEVIRYNETNQKVYIALTNNTNRMPNQVDAANPRPQNRDGHIIEFAEAGNDPTALTFTWSVFMLCGDPQQDNSTYFAGFPKDQISAISSPDNLGTDLAGNLWIMTDGQWGTLKKTDAIFAVPVEGPNRGAMKLFLTSVPGCEVATAEFSLDNEALFVSIQHPGEGGTFEKPVSRWPDNSSLPRPSVVVTWNTSDGAKVIGS